MSLEKSVPDVNVTSADYDDSNVDAKLEGLSVQDRDRTGDGDEEQAKIQVPFGKEMRKLFLFEEGYRNLNHGSFGAYPIQVRKTFLDLNLLCERHPDKFIRYTYIPLLNEARAAIATQLLNVPVDTLVFVPNALTGVNTVLRSLTFEPGDKIVYFDFIYMGCEKVMNYIEDATPAKGVKIWIDLRSSVEEIVRVFRETIVREGGGAFDDKLGERKSGQGRVKLAFFDTVASLPGVRLPFEKLVEACKELGVYSLVDAAHGIGHIKLDIGKLDPDFLVTNCYKWLHTPRGSAVFYVPFRNQHLITSIPTAHGYIPLAARKNGTSSQNLLPPNFGPISAYFTMFLFTGTMDNTPYICVPSALRFRNTICGGEDKIIDYCTSLAKSGAELIADAFSTEIFNNQEGTLTDCCMANARLPIAFSAREGDVTVVEKADQAKVIDYMFKKMLDDYNIFLAVFEYREDLWVRVSAQIYLEIEDFEYAVQVLKELVEQVKRKEYI